MPALPMVRGAEVVRVLQKAGFQSVLGQSRPQLAARSAAYNDPCDEEPCKCESHALPAPRARPRAGLCAGTGERSRRVSRTARRGGTAGRQVTASLTVTRPRPATPPHHPHAILRSDLATNNVISKVGLPWAAALDKRLHQGAFGLDGMHQIVSRPLMY